jgi:hypothetical protein
MRVISPPTRVFRDRLLLPLPLATTHRLQLTGRDAPRAEALGTDYGAVTVGGDDEND